MAYLPKFFCHHNILDFLIAPWMIYPFPIILPLERRHIIKIAAEFLDIGQTLKHGIHEAGVSQVPESHHFLLAVAIYPAVGGRRIGAGLLERGVTTSRGCWGVLSGTAVFGMRSFPWTGAQVAYRVFRSLKNVKKKDIRLIVWETIGNYSSLYRKGLRNNFKGENDLYVFKVVTIWDQL